MKFKLVLIVMFFWISPMISQEKAALNYSNKPLSEVITDLELKYDIRFSFNSDVINAQTITFQDDSVTLQQVLSVIENQTNLEFQKASERYYLLKAKKNLSISDTQQLEEVLITEFLTTGVNKKKEGTITLSSKKLGVLPGLTEPDVLQSLQLLPGVQSPSETASGLYIRGGTPDQNLILWDGIKMYHSGHFFGMISAFNPYVTDNITLSTNGTNARYGNTISSVINIDSYSDIPAKTEGGFGFNMTHVDLFFKIPVTEKLGLILSHRRSYTDAINTFTFKSFSKRVFQNTKISEGNRLFDDDDVSTIKDFFSFSDLTLKAVYKPSSNNEFSVSSLMTRNKLDYSFLIREFDEESEDNLGIKNEGLSASWNHTYNENFSHKLLAYYSKYNFEYSGNNNYSNIFRNVTTKSNNIKDYGFLAEGNIKINPSNNLSLGYQLTSSDIDYGFSFDNNYNPDIVYNEENSHLNNTHTLYGNYGYDKNKWFLNLGLRANYNSLLSRTYFEPRFYSTYKLTPNLKYKLSLEQLHQTVSQIVEFNTQNFGLENQVWALSDNDLIPTLKSNQVSTGLAFNRKGWNIDVDFYLKRIKGLTSSARGFNNTNNSFAEGESNITGLDIFIKKKINNYRTWLSYSVLKNDYKFNAINNGDIFPGNFHIAHQLNWSHSYKWKALDFSLGWSYRTGAPYTQALGLHENDNSIVYDKINNERFPEYHRLDFSTTYNFDISTNGEIKGKFGVSILNLYNNKTVINKTYKVRVNEEQESFLQEADKISLGFTPNLVFRVNF